MKLTPMQQSIPLGRNPLLELCPFCGEPAELYACEGEPGCRVRCSNPKCSFKPCSSAPFLSEELAVKAWNTRKGAQGDTRSLARALLDETRDNEI